MRARHRLSKLLLRHGLVYEQGRARTLAHDAWLPAQRLDQAGARAAFDDYYGAVLAARLRREGLDERISELAREPRWAPVVGRLGCLRGIGTLTAFALTVEIGDWHRLTGASIGAYLGLVPTERQSGPRHRRGPITRAGNCHAGACWSRPPGTAGRCGPAPRSRGAGPANAPRLPPAPSGQVGVCTTAGTSSSDAAGCVRPSWRRPSRASWRAGAGAWP
jgi:transposase